MGFWKALGKAAQVAKSYVPLASALPLPPKVRTGIVKGAQIEQEAEDLVRELKAKDDPPKPAA